ncbi:MAG: ABC transporter permease [Bacteroidia bacterium]|nr:ABC transporter permease [Bacteroidia bacterium]
MNTPGIAKLLQERVFTLSLTLVILVGVCSLIWPDTFLTFSNLSTLLLNISTDSVVVIGMMILLISGTFDLSVGSVYALSGGLAAYLAYNYGMFTPVAILVGLGVAVLIGFINGLLITKVGINPLIQTLATLGIVRGIFDLMGKVATLPEGFDALGTSRLMGIQTPFWVMISLVIIFSILVSRHVFFRRYYYIGGNEKAARLSGIPVNRLKVWGFMLSAFLAGVAGILFVSRMGAVPDTLGKGLELKIITAAILGGASLLGGQGKITGAFLGVIFIHLISNILVFARVSGQWTDIIFGIILVLAISLDIFLKKNAEIRLTESLRNIYQQPKP